MLAQLLLCGLMVGFPPDGFQPVGGSPEVRVYRRQDKGVIDLAAEGTFAATPERIQRILLDYANHPRWVEHLVESRVLDRGKDSLDVYERLDLPVLRDRDYTLHVTWGRDGETRWVRFTATQDDRVPPRRGTIRIKVHEGEWILQPIDNGHATRAQYRFRLDLAGIFPSWMGRGRAAHDLPSLFESIRNQLNYYREEP